MKRRNTWERGGRTPTWCLATGLALWAGSASAAPAEPIMLRRMVAACSVSMANDVCSVAKAASATAAGAGGRSRPAVFVVGAGAVDPAAYSYLQDGGKAMCARAQSACTADWSGKVCVTARSLWAD